MENAQAILAVIGPFLEKVPEGVCFSLDCGVGNRPGLIVVGSTQASVQSIRACFPPMVWKREWNKLNNWWAYTAQLGEVNVKLIGVSENPAQCRAITEKRMVKKQVPVMFKEREEEQEVIVGWDCGKPNTEQQGETLTEEEK